MNELLFASDIIKKDCMEMLSEALIPFDPKAKVAEFRLLLIEHKLALAPEAPEPTELIEVIGVAYHDCEMAGQVLKIRSGEKYELDGWKAEALVNFGACEFV